MRKLLVVAALGAASLGTQVMAQVAPPVGPPAAGAPVNAAPGGQFGRRMHRDLTRQQAQQMADSMFQRFDANRDGMLTRDEAQQALAQVAAARGGASDTGEGDGRAQRMLDRMFAGAQSVTLAQFEGQALARFDRQDLNRDGVVTSAERQQGRENRVQ